MKGKIDRTRLLVIVGVAVAVLVAGATWALAQTEGVINACVNTSDGTLRIVADPACKKNEVLLSWNMVGPQGDPGLACWDLNGNGAADPEEDVNGDGVWDALDCAGPQGEPGTDGLDGTDGSDGLACWDLNGDGIQDAAEDVNLDGLWDALDCQGPQGEPGDTANVDALEAQVAALQEQVDALALLHGKTVFATSARTYTGNLGGLSGAAATCQAAAQAAGLSGTFKAWLSDSTASPSTRFTHSALPYLLVTGAKVADNWADLTDGSLDHAIDVNESGGTVTAGAWTGTRPDGTALGDDCAGWTIGYSTPDYLGSYGRVVESGPAWTQYGWRGLCDMVLRLYCFEQ